MTKRTLFLVVLVVAAAVVPFGAQAHARAVKASSYPVTFTVQNVNRSQVPCATDGATYKIRGHVTGPRAALAKPFRKVRKPAVTLYLHGLGLGEWFWTFRGLSSRTVPPGVPVDLTKHPVISGYDYATAQAKGGHFSITIDRLGYGASDYLDGKRICLGSQADIAHQIVQALRSGSYQTTGSRALRYKKVAIAGHSIGAEIAMIEAYSFRDVDNLIVASFSAQNQPRAQLALGPTRDACLKGGQAPFSLPPGSPPPQPLGGPPSGYAPYGTGTPADFQAVMFRSAKKQVRDAGTSLRSLDPCGDTDSIIPALLQQQAQVAKVKVPVLVICGRKDALFAPLGCEIQSERFRNSRRVRLELVPNAGHAITLEASAPTFRRKVGRWLSRYGF